VIGTLLLALFLGTEASAIASLVQHQEPDSSNSSLIISASALVIMVLIWLPKRFLARALDSSTMKGEATCSLSCIQITAVLFIGSLVFRLWKGGWWVDAATALLLGLLFGWEGVKMVRWARDPAFSGGCCKDCKSVTVDQVELGEQYRDICDCCLEKEECRQSDRCKCSSQEMEGKESSVIIHLFICKGQCSYWKTSQCCSPMKSSGEMCCTRAVLPTPRPYPRPAQITQSSEPNHSIQDSSGVPADAQDPSSKSDSLSSCGLSDPQIITTEKTGCCAGCHSG
jgi:hypothetical protein